MNEQKEGIKIEVEEMRKNIVVFSPITNQFFWKNRIEMEKRVLCVWQTIDKWNDTKTQCYDMVEWFFSKKIVFTETNKNQNKINNFVDEINEVIVIVLVFLKNLIKNRKPGKKIL